jgi:hypothetical protein
MHRLPYLATACTLYSGSGGTHSQCIYPTAMNSMYVSHNQGILQNCRGSTLHKMGLPAKTRSHNSKRQWHLLYVTHNTWTSGCSPAQLCTGAMQHQSNCGTAAQDGSAAPLHHPTHMRACSSHHAGPHQNISCGCVMAGRCTADLQHIPTTAVTRNSATVPCTSLRHCQVRYILMQVRQRGLLG